MSEIIEEAPINKLPDECFQHIFSFLPVGERLEAEKVCKDWRRISQRGWNDVKKLEIPRWKTGDKTYSILKRCGRFLRKLRIELIPQNSNCLSMAIECCKLDQLEAIDIAFCRNYKELKFEPDDLREIIKRATNLVAVKLFWLDQQDMNDCVNLLDPVIVEKLRLHVCRDRILVEPLTIELDQFRNLKELELINFKISAKEIERGNESWKNLEELEITDCDLSQNFLEKIQTFTNLKKLTYAHNECAIEYENIRSIAKHCCKLQEIELREINAVNLTSRCFKWLGRMPSLEILTVEIYDMNNQHIKHLKNVKELCFENCSSTVCGDGLLALIKNSSNLEELAFIRMGKLKRFMGEMGKIFHSGQRQKPLRIYISDCWDVSGYDEPEGDADHPLISWDIN